MWNYFKGDFMKTSKSFVLFLFLYSTLGFSKESLTVRFTHKGKKFIFKASSEKGKYIFNKGAKKVIKVATLDWMPYVGKKLCKQGWVQQYTVAILGSLGYEVQSSFFPWARAVSRVEKGKFDILYPEYFIEDSAPSDAIQGTKRIDHLAVSRPFPGGPIAFMARKGYKAKYNKNNQKSFLGLKGERIGAVRGYQNTPEFDKLMDSKPPFFKMKLSKNDVLNAKILDSRKVNLIIGDPSVIKYSVKTEKKLSAKRKEKILSNIETVTPHIQYNNLYFALSKKKSGWKELLRKINSRIAEFEKEGTMVKIIDETNKQCKLSMDDTLRPYRK